MLFEQFKTISEDVFAAIPPEFREGVDGLEISRKTVPHPELPEIYTLGECLSDFYPSDYGGAGEVRSRVVLYYGSFLQLSRTHEDWDWEEEIYETITHEIRHHLEHLALEDDLTEMDYAEDQNFARREGEPFDPFFFRSGKPLGEGAFEVDGDVFVEREVSGGQQGERLAVTLDGRAGTARVPDLLDADVTYLYLPTAAEGDAESFVVLVRKKGWMAMARGLLSARPLTVEEVEGVWEPNEGAARDE